MQPCLKPRETRKVEKRETQHMGKMEVRRDNRVMACLINTDKNPSPSWLAEQLQSVTGTAAACPWLVPAPRLPVSGWVAVDVPRLCPKLLLPAAFTSRQPSCPQKSLLSPLMPMELGCSAPCFTEDGGEGGGRVASSAG